MDDKEYFKTKYATHWCNESVNIYNKSRHYYNFIHKLILDRKPARILELGFGTGKPTAAELTPYTQLYCGIDLAYNTLSNYNINAKFKPHALQLINADIQALPILSNRFDCVICIASSFYVNLYDLIEEMIRVTNNNGFIVFDVINIYHVNGLAHYIYKFFREMSCVRYIAGYSFVPHTQSVFAINNFFDMKQINYNFYGFEILLPSYFPLLRDKVNIVKYFKSLNYDLNNSNYLKFLGSKLLYIVDVNK